VSSTLRVSIAGTGMVEEVAGKGFGLVSEVDLLEQRGRVAERQAPAADVGIAVNTGGVIDGDAGFVGVHAVRAGG
jgi:hypothetical protein